MIGDWLTGIMKERALRQGAREIDRFVDGLRAMPDRDVGVIVAAAHAVRVNMETHGVIPEGVFAAEDLPSIEAMGAMQMKINRVAREFAKTGQTADVAGATVWSYSLRSLNVAGLRPHGRALWAEMRRGFPHVAEALDEGEERRGKPFARRVWDEWRTIPIGLEPE